MTTDRLSIVPMGTWEAGDITGDCFLPPAVVTEVLAFLGKRGSGKTYAAGVLVEGLLSRDQQVVIMDPVGNWWGLRLHVDGTAPGFAIPVLGGDHGDLALPAEVGAAVADMVVDTGTSIVLDLSLMTGGQRRRFVTDFCERFFHRKAGKDHRSPVHVVIEEAHVLLPQKAQSGEERMLGAVQALVRRGRNYGIGVSIIDQRPQSVSKDSLNQAECLFVFQLVGKLERKAILDWAEEQDLAGKVKSELGALSQIEKGHCLLWSPSWLKKLGRIKVTGKMTFDASRTPESIAEAATAPKPRPILKIEAIKEALADAFENAITEDPKILREQIGKLQRDLERARQERDSALALRKQEIQRPRPGYIELSVASFQSLGRMLGNLSLAVNGLDKLVRSVDEDAFKAVASGFSLHPRQDHDGDGPCAACAPEVTMTPAYGNLPPQYTVAGASPVGPKIDALAALGPTFMGKPIDGREAGAPWVKFAAAIRDMGHSLTIVEASVLCGYSAGASTGSAIASKLRKLGWIASEERGRMKLTPEGWKHVRGVKMVIGETPEERIRRWSASLGGTEARVFEYIASRFPGGPTDAEICKAVGISTESSTLSAIKSKLRKKGILSRGRGVNIAAAILFRSATPTVSRPA